MTENLSKLRQQLPHRQVQCESMAEVRREIDELDRHIVELLSIRQCYIEQAGQLKADRNTVRDQKRVEDVVSKATAHALKVGAHPDMIETVYRPLIEWCINYEFTVFDGKKDT